MARKQLALLLTPVLGLLLGSPSVRAQGYYGGPGVVNGGVVSGGVVPGGVVSGGMVQGGVVTGEMVSGEMSGGVVGAPGASCGSGGCGKPGLFGLRCPGYHFCSPNPPRICFRCVCACKTVCEPCDIKGDGYYPTCWRPYMQQVSYCHCPIAPPTVVMPHFKTPVAQPALTPTEPEEMLPPPKSK